MDIPAFTLATRVVLVMHTRERAKPTATGPLALLSLPNSTTLIHGERDDRLDLNQLFTPERRVLLLYPAEGARSLADVAAERGARPITLIVPDGNWRQAARAARRIPGVERAECVVLPAGEPTEWGVREETKDGGLSTFEAIARAIGILEGEAIEAAMMTVFRKMVAHTWEMRGGTPGKTPAPMAEGQRPPLAILFDDAHLVAIDKPAGALVHRGWGDDAVPILQMLREQIGQRLYPVHRLDRATSGVLLFAKSSAVARDVQAQFSSRAVEKSYVALCRGHDAGLVRVDHPLAKEKGAERKPSVTTFRMLGHSGRYGLFEARPETGRLHQIRRHLKHASHPIIGDVRYGKGEHNRIFRERYNFGRLALHCSRLALLHPRTGAQVQIRAALPADFMAVLALLGIPYPPTTENPPSPPQ